MKVESISSLTTVPVSNLLRALVSETSIALPVDSSQYLYSNFKHIRGIPAPGNSTGYSLSRLKAVDNLIDRLQMLKGTESAGRSLVPETKETEPTALDRRLDTLRRQLNETLNSRISLFRGFEGLDTGLSLDLFV